MVVASAVIMMVLSTSVLQVYGSDFLQFYPLQKTLETALTRDETLYNMKQAFFPAKQIHAQEVDQVRINVCVEITVNQTLNSTLNDLYIVIMHLLCAGSFCGPTLLFSV